VKKIEAIIKPSRLDDVREALSALGLSGATVLEARGFGRVRAEGAAELRGAPYVFDLAPRAKLEIFVADARVGEVVEAIARAAKTGREGDGRIAVSPVEELIRIRTGERGEDAL
jgi:nitrogen regulatory protein P-II 1